MIARLISLFLVVALLASWPALGEVVPPHLARMAASIYKQTETQDQPHADAGDTRATARERAFRILRKTGMQRWAAGPARLPGFRDRLATALKLDLSDKDAQTAIDRVLKADPSGRRDAADAVAAARSEAAGVARLLEIESEIVEALAEVRDGIPQHARIETGEKETVDISWEPDTGRVRIAVEETAEGEAVPSRTVLSGRVEENATSPEQNDGRGDLALVANLDDDPVHVTIPQDIIAFRDTILGEWIDGSGYRYRFSASDGDVGQVALPREHYDRQIRALEDRIERIEADRRFVWIDPSSGDLVRQRKFKRMGEPYEYLGERYAMPNAETRIAELEAKIEELAGERDSRELLPIDAHDPIDFAALDGEDARGEPIAVEVFEDGSVGSRYDSARFDGRRIVAKSTFKRAEHLNPVIPMVIRQELVTGWNPPHWLELDAIISVETGDLTLDGNYWALHVTYGYDGSSYGPVKRIHTPYPTALTMRRFGGRIRVAWGAGTNQQP